ncbi:MAG: DUF167 domain-containing protein [Elusimicrobiales bacterium]|nr:DUF167 domain-containing protein [Elusimicrobiales bacterium]HOL63006.1 DUF167 domain-containing protein [Elusimicrobiales bacterium]HPO95863.1 DUF167 domain-containing protein [Elusimicrobiales bacterium]
MIVKVRVIPNCDDNEVISRIGKVLRVRVCASKDDNEINVILRQYLAQFFEVREKCINIVRGLRGKEKTIEITGKSESELEDIINTIP